MTYHHRLRDSNTFSKVLPVAVVQLLEPHDHVAAGRRAGDVLDVGLIHPDVGIVDGAVNGAGTTTRGAWAILRQMQSGNIRSYAGWVALGAAGLVAYMLWMGLQ